MKPSAFAVAALLALLAACTTPTPYQPLTTGTTSPGGYTDQRLDDTHFRVTFSGNTATSREQVEDYLLYRAAELTTGKGFDWFEMVDRHTENTGESYITPEFYGYGAGWGYWRPSWRFHRHGGWAYGPWGGPWGWDDYEVRTFRPLHRHRGRRRRPRRAAGRRQARVRRPRGDAEPGPQDRAAGPDAAGALTARRAEARFRAPWYGR